MNAEAKNQLIYTALKRTTHLGIPGSINKHHCYPMGLFAHTMEVMYFAKQSAINQKLKLDVVEVASAWHDVGKIKCYELIDGGNWTKVSNYDQQMHIRESERMFREHLKYMGGLGLSFEEVDHIVHIIRSHHGRMDYGAIEEPNSPEAWAVHLADMTSVFCVGGRQS
jgi:3'-5' exoribonuclease